MNYLAVDELDIVGALRIAVSGSVLGTSLVVGVLCFTTIRIHLDKVHGTVKTTGELGDIDVECELLVLGLEHLVSDIGGVHQIDTGADVLAGALGDELMSERVAAGGDTVGAAVVGAIDGTVLGTESGGRTELGVPGTSGVAVVETGGGVQPAPIGIKNDRGLLVGTATGGGALCPGELGMNLRSQGANLLGRNGEEEGERDEGGGGGHCGGDRTANESEAAL